MQNENTMDRNLIINIMNRLDFFKEFTTGEKHVLANLHKNYSVYPKGEKIISEGEHDNSLFILLSGKVSVKKSGNRLPIIELFPGDFFGEFSFIANTVRSADVVAEEKSIVIKVTNKIFKVLEIEIREKIKDKIINKLIERLIHMNEVYEKMSF